MSEVRVVDDAEFERRAAGGHDGPSTRLRGNLGIFQLVFTILAFNGPLAVVVGFAPVVIGYGNGLGAPAAYISAAVVVSLFAAGFTKMARHVQNPGGFYSYVTLGLGREIGLGASFLALACYYLLNLGCYAFLGLTMNSLVDGTLNGPNIDWWVWAFLMQAFVAYLNYFNLDVSAKVLSWLLAGEVLIIVVYDAAVVLQGGDSGLTGNSFLPSNMFSGSIGLALLFGMMCMGGFEVTAIFRDEVRDPDRTIPRATYAFIGTIGVLYGLTTWVIVEGLGEQKAVAAAGVDPTGAFLSTMQTFVGTAGVDLVNVLLNTSVLAATIATQSVLTRYVFNLSVDGILPSYLGQAHDRHGSPARASLATSVAVLLGFIPFVLVGADPAVLYAQLTGGFGYALLVLLLITTIAVPLFLRRTRPSGVSAWHHTVAPVLAGISLVVVLYLATKNIDVLITAGNGLIITMLAGLYGTIALGIIVALILKAKRPDVYARIGRQ